MQKSIHSVFVSSFFKIGLTIVTAKNTQLVKEILTDCDQDVLLLKAVPQGKGAACHTGRRSCFYRRVEKGGLVFTDEARLFDPKDVY